MIVPIIPIVPRLNSRIRPLLLTTSQRQVPYAVSSTHLQLAHPIHLDLLGRPLSTTRVLRHGYLIHTRDPGFTHQVHQVLSHRGTEGGVCVWSRSAALRRVPGHRWALLWHRWVQRTGRVVRAGRWCRSDHVGQVLYLRSTGRGGLRCPLCHLSGSGSGSLILWHLKSHVVGLNEACTMCVL